MTTSVNVEIAQAPASRADAVSVAVGAIITGTIASNVRHPEAGLIVAIPNCADGFVPNGLLAGHSHFDKMERREFLIANAGQPIDLLVKEAAMHVPEPKDGRVRAARPRIILDEQAVFVARALEADQNYVASLTAGTVVHAVVMDVRMKKNEDGKGHHHIGWILELESLYTAFLHKSEVVGEIQVGDYLYVAVRSAEMKGDRPMISVSHKAAQAKIALITEVKAGSRTTGRDLRQDSVEGIDGFTMLIGKGDGVKAFLPLADVEGDPASLLKGNRTAKVTVLPLTIGEYVKVTRRSLVAEVVAHIESAA